ncbi:hypothetical protein EMIT0P100_150119 [Pseudomonas sp. IT-P100]
MPEGYSERPVGWVSQGTFRDFVRSVRKLGECYLSGSSGFWLAGFEPGFRRVGCQGNP